MRETVPSKFVRDPHRSGTESDIDRAVADSDRVHDPPLSRVDAKDDAPLLVGDPDAV